MNSVSKVKIAVGYTLLLAVLFFSLFFVHREMENLILTDDQETALTAEGRSAIQNDCYNFYKTILNWRKGNDVIAKGSMTQFMVQNGVYAYARQHEGKTVFVMLNGTNAETVVPLKFYKEILKEKQQGKDILTGKAIIFGKELKMQPRESLVIEL